MAGLRDRRRRRRRLGRGRRDGGARTLARAGLAVVVLEEGRRYTAADFRERPPLDRFLELYRDGAPRSPSAARRCCCPPAGASAVRRSSTAAPRTGRRTACCAAGPRPGIAVGPASSSLLDEVERTLRVEPPVPRRRRPQRAARPGGAERLGWRAAPLRRNAPGCDGCCQCVVGCPHNAKNGVHLNALPQACAAGARHRHRRARRPDPRPSADGPSGVRAVRPGRLGAGDPRPAGRRRGGRHADAAAAAPVRPRPATRSSAATSPSTRPPASAGRFEEPVVSWRACCRASASRNSTTRASSSRRPRARRG